MPDMEKVIKGLECCQPPYDCHNCPYDWDYCFMKNQLHKDAIAVLQEQERIIKQYQKADGFLFAHGWKWEGR